MGPRSSNTAQRAGLLAVAVALAAPEDEPVMGDACVECDAPLPGRSRGGPAIAN